MWAAILGPLMEILKWLTGALVAEAKQPVPGLVIDASPADVAHAESARAAAASFPGIGKLALLGATALALGGCSIFEQRVIMPRPAVPVVLAQDLKEVRVLVKLDETHWAIGICDLHAGELVMADPLDYPAELVNKNAATIAKGQNLKLEK